ncbi:unnamed protein product [Auanema sp. JU1783]|nr:unnamed protein product [Auanema sp. JU1783]
MQARAIEHIVFSHSRSIPHVHITGLIESGVEDFVWNTGANYVLNNTWKTGKVNCLHCDGNLKVLIHDLCESVRLPTKKIDTIESLGVAIRNLLNKTPGVQLLLMLTDSDGLSKLNSHARHALLNLPQADFRVRIVTISERTWQLFEVDQYVESFNPVQLHWKLTRDPVVMVDGIQKRLDVERSLAQTVVGSVQEHTLDPAIFDTVVIQTLRDTSDNTNFRARVPEVFRSVENQKMLSKHSQQENDLPLSLRLLLIASYCATHNTPSTDKRFFAKHHGREVRNEAQDRRNALIENDPKAVDLQRIYFIYTVLARLQSDDIKKLGVNLTNSINIRSQITTLVAMGLLARSSASANLDQPKYRCIVSFEYAGKLARSVGMELTDYLEKKF